MALHRELAKTIKREMVTAGTVPWYQKPTTRTPMQQWYHREVLPIWFKWAKGPWERWCYEKRVTICRGYFTTLTLLVSDDLNFVFVIVSY